MRPAGLFFLALLASAACSSAGVEEAEAHRARPNVVLFLVDDLGWQDVSHPLHTERTPFNDRYHTPHLERLAARGTTFTNAYAAAPVCTPTRTSLMTGQWPARTHITYWTLWKDRDQSAAFPGVRAPAWNVNGLQEDDVTLARLLQEDGYRTIHVGKAHFGAVGTSGADPTRLGFDVNVAGHGPGGPASYYGTHDFTVAKRDGPGGVEEPSVWDVPGLEAYHGTDTYLTEALTTEAKKHVRAAVADGRPFFLNFAPYAVHAPILANERYLSRYEGLDAREAAYATMIETVDVALGELVALLEELDVTEDTIVVFTSDNGGLSAHARGGEKHTHNAPLRSGKGSAYEGGIRVPQVVAWPGVTDGLRRNARTERPVVTHDLFPTILRWAGVEPPPTHPVDGRDIAPLLLGREARSERALFWHQPHYWGVAGPGIEPFTAVRRGPWKLIFRHRDRGFELYDLDADLGERRDLASREPERVARLARELGLWMHTVGAQSSIDEATGAPLDTPDAYVP